MLAVKKENLEPIPGYRLLERLGSGGFGEVWKCAAPGGLFKAIKFVSGPSHPLDDDCRAERELRALQRIKAIRHPYLLSMERVEVIDGDLLIVMELADRSLHDLLQERRGKGRPGIPRAELLGYLREAAEALDVMNREHGLQHLDIKPRNLFLLGQHVKVADFGLVDSLHDLPDQADPRNAVTPLYAAPELFHGRITPFCDQYSLAITYQELLTGTFPFSGKTLCQMVLQHAQSQPDLVPLPEADWAVVGRALSKEPAERFPTCLAFVRALEAVRSAPSLVPSQDTDRPVCPGEMSNTTPWPAEDVSATLAATPSPRPSADTDAHRQVVAATVVAAAGNREGRSPSSWCTLHLDPVPGAIPHLEVRCFGRLLPEAVRRKLARFQEQWQADPIDSPAGDEEPPIAGQVAYCVPLPGSMWQRWLGRRQSLEVHIRPQAPATPTGPLTEVAVQVFPRCCTAEQGAKLLGTAGPVVLHSLRESLQLHTERRREERFAYPCSIRVSAMLPTGEAGRPSLAQGKDISTCGLGLILPCCPPSSRVYLQFPAGDGPPVVVPARIVRVQPLADGRFEAGLCFAWDES